MRYLLIFMLLVAVFVVGKRSCHFSGFGIEGSGPTKTETRNLSGFHAVDMDLAGEVEVHVGDYKVEIQAQENLLPILKSTVENGRLRLYFAESVSNTHDLKIIISAPAFDSFVLGGSGDIHVIDPIQADKMNVDITGSGTIRIPQANFNTLDCNLGGSGEIELAGKANVGDVDISGSGEIQAKGMEFNELNSNVSGSGSISAHVLQRLKANISGSGDIYYGGNPASVESTVSGSGSVSKL